MTRLRRWLAVGAVLLTAAVAVAVPAPAYACSCAYPYDGPESVARADVIFTAHTTQTQVRGDRRIFTFAVDRVYRGEARAVETVTSHRDGATCGLEIAGPGPFIVLAQRDADTTPLGPVEGLSSDLCSGTRLGSRPPGLGEGYPPLPVPSEAPTPTAPAEPPLFPAVLIVLALAAGAGFIGSSVAVLGALRDDSAGAKR